MKHIILMITASLLMQSANASVRHKKEKWYEDHPTTKHHRNSKKIAANVATVAATSAGKELIENEKRRRDKNYAPQN
jgi:hypothetical protein